MKLIDKDAVLAIIEKFMYGANIEADIASTGECFDEKVADAKYQLCKCIKGKIDTLEVKDVDLDFTKDVDMWIEDNGDSNGFFNVQELAKHFYELGLQAQKGEIWQVVDNVTHPQADKNKIYCVFTKNRYILATVINHPKDEELLQWKCTEFPHHRYDMCEGDKYMQIV